MDLSRISTKDLEYINAGQLDKVSTAGLQEYSRQQNIASQPRSLGEEFQRGTGLAFRGLAPVAVGGGLGFALGGPIGAGFGAATLPLAELGTQAVNLALPKEYQIPSPYGAVENLLTQLGLPVPETTGERVIQSLGGALPTTAAQNITAQALSQTAKTQLGRNVAEQMAREPGRQLVATVPATAAGQYVGETTGSPVAGMFASMLAGAPFAAGTRPSGPTKSVLEAKSAAAFEAANKSGIALNPTIFSDEMGKIAVNLRQEGYTPTGYPKIEAVFREMSNTSMPKDFTELQALRKMIQTVQGSADPAERRLASILKDRFDDYILNADKTQIVGAGTKEGVNAWKQARNTYSRMMKADIFENMLENAKLDQSKFTQSGAENSMAQQLRNLAKNPNKMRLFTEAEQAEIKAAAKGSTALNLLKFFGRFAPTGPVSSILPGGAIVANPYVGVPLALGATGARMGATSLRRQSVENLADFMRSGVLQPRQQSAVRTMATRGLISPQTPVTEEEINLIMGR